MAAILSMGRWVKASEPTLNNMDRYSYDASPPRTNNMAMITEQKSSFLQTPEALRVCL